MQLHLATLVSIGGNGFLSDWGPLQILNWRFVKSVAEYCCTEGKEVIAEAAGFKVSLLQQKMSLSLSLSL
jgi:hypothetical protein